MPGALRATTRQVARAAVRAQLAQVAFDLFRRDGFDRVTINDIAAAAGVSRSTVLRYFGTKEDAVLGAVDLHGERLAAALRERPAEEDDWTALRRTMDVIIGSHRSDPAGTLALAQLIRNEPALAARQLEKQSAWLRQVAEALASRPSGPAGLRADVRAAAALDCLTLAVDRWADADGRSDVGALLDEAFSALSGMP